MLRRIHNRWIFQQTRLFQPAMLGQVSLHLVNHPHHHCQTLLVFNQIECQFSQIAWPPATFSVLILHQHQTMTSNRNRFTVNFLQIHRIQWTDSIRSMWTHPMLTFHQISQSHCSTNFSGQMRWSTNQWNGHTNDCHLKCSPIDTMNPIRMRTQCPRKILAAVELPNWNEHLDQASIKERTIHWVADQNSAINWVQQFMKIVIVQVKRIAT